MPYCIVNWVPDPEGGRRPDLPEGLGFCLLAGPHHSDFALFDVSELPSTADTVDSTLEGLLNSAAVYPPALAIARDRVERHTLSREEFPNRLCELLREELDAQRSSRAFLACVRGIDNVYTRDGQYYWIVDYRPEYPGREVWWVSRDYFVYQDSIDAFDIERDQLIQRFGRGSA